MEDLAAERTEERDGGAKIRGEGRGDFTADAGGEFAAVVGSGETDLEGAVGVGGEEGEGAESGGVDDVEGDAEGVAEVGDVDFCWWVCQWLGVGKRTV